MTKYIYIGKEVIMNRKVKVYRKKNSKKTYCKKKEKGKYKMVSIKNYKKYMNKKMKGGVKSSKKYTKKKFNYSKIKESVNKSLRKAELKASQLKSMYISKKTGPLLSILKDKMLVDEGDRMIHKKKKSVRINPATIQKKIKKHKMTIYGKSEAGLPLMEYNGGFFFGSSNPPQKKIVLPRRPSRIDNIHRERQRKRMMQSIQRQATNAHQQQMQSDLKHAYTGNMKLAQRKLKR